MNNNTKRRFKALSKKERREIAKLGIHRKSRYPKVGGRIKTKD